MTARLPAFPLALMTDGAELTPAAFHAHILMLRTAWRSAGGSLPNDSVYLSRVTRTNLTHTWGRLQKHVLALWSVGADGRLHHKGLNAEREKALRLQSRQRARGVARALKYMKTAPAANVVPLNVVSSVSTGVRNQPSALKSLDTPPAMAEPRLPLFVTVQPEFRATKEARNQPSALKSLETPPAAAQPALIGVNPVQSTNGGGGSGAPAVKIAIEPASPARAHAEDIYIYNNYTPPTEPIPTILGTEPHRESSETGRVGLGEGTTSTPTGTPAKSKARIAHRMSPEWTLSAANRAYALKCGVAPDRTADVFRDYWLGTGRPMLDWDATWRNWCRREQDKAIPVKRRLDGGALL